MIGGYTGMGFEPKAEVFALKAGQEWQRVAPLPEARGALAAAALGQKIFAIGGIGPQGLANDLFVYEPSQDSWITKSPAPTKRDHLAAAALGGLFYVAGGREKSLAENLTVVEFYDPRADLWGTGPLLPTARGGVAGAAFDELLLSWAASSRAEPSVR